MVTYKTSSLRLYYTNSGSKWELLPHKLFIVDNIGNYLDTKNFLSINDFQYQKPQLELSINVDLSQTYAEPLNQSFKYVRITNNDQQNRHYYYFVKNTIWRSKSAVRLDLVMDVLNTFKEDTDYTFKDTTKITREHKDRFLLGNESINVNFSIYINDHDGAINLDDTVGVVQAGVLICEGTVLAIDSYNIYLNINKTPDEFEAIFDTTEETLFAKDNNNYILCDITGYTYNISGLLYRNIDYVQENINPTLQCGDAKGALVENTTTSLRKDWYLLYRNQNDPSDSLVNPVECYLLPSSETSVLATAISGGKIVAASLNANYNYYIAIDPLSTDTITLEDATIISGATGGDTKIISFRRNADNTITLTSLYGPEMSQNAQPYYEGTWTVNYFILNNMPRTYYYSTNSQPSVTAFDVYCSTVRAYTSGTFQNTSSITTLNGIEDLDRTQSKNIKLIKLPYCPYNFTMNSNKIDVSSDYNWDVVNLENIIVLKLNNLNTSLTASFTNYLYNPTSKLYVGNIGVINPNKTDLRKGMTYESKLFNSEFYRPTFVYDSFQFAVQLEKCDMDYYMQDITYVTHFRIKFDMTRTINSRFMFTFTEYELRNATESYANVMPIARNNEEVLYNVPYINYIRNGYNYDVKAKNISTASTWVGAGLSLAGVGASLLLPSVPLKVAGIVSSLISMAMTTKNAITTTIQNEQSIQRKLHETALQTASVSGSDDVDLMSVYTENRLKYLIYEPTEIMKNMIYNLFFFAGYSSNRLGLPNHNTRINFDYLECDAQIDSVGNIPQECLNELINCFKNGVTYIHETRRTTDKWDFEQKYENWEKSLGVN